jgi:alpha-glucosidase
VYLPKGDWYDFWTGKRYEGGKGMKVPLVLENIPVFVRGGAFVFRQPVIQHTGEMPGQPLIVDVYPAARSEASLYEDDGATLDYTRGGSVRRAFRQVREEGRTVIDIGAGAGAYRPRSRDLMIRVRLDSAPGRVRVANESLAPIDTSKPGVKGWSRSADGVVTVRMPDRFDAFQVSIEP